MDWKNHLVNTRYLVLTFIFTASIVGLVIFSPGVHADGSYSIPSWIKTISTFWANDNISDQEFVSALQFLVNEKILVIPNTDTNDDHHAEGLIVNQQPAMQEENSIDLIVSVILKKCERDDICIAFSLSNLSKNEPDNVVMSVLNGVISEWDNEKISCHQDAHHLGHFVYEFNGRDIEKSLSYADNKCGNGLYHGIIEDSLLFEARAQNTDIAGMDVTSACVNIGDSLDSNIRQQCLHGMGHAILLAYDYDLFNAIKRCDEFQTFTEQDMCHDGIFMQNHILNFDNGGGVFDKNDIYYPCNAVEEQYQNRCYIYQAYYILKENNYAYLPAFEDCENIPTSSEKIIGGCIGGIANYFSSKIYLTDVEKIANMCDEVNPNYQNYCINVAVFSLTRYVDTEIAEDFCNALPEEKFDNCILKWNDVKITSEL